MTVEHELSPRQEVARPVVSDYWNAHLKMLDAQHTLREQRDVLARNLAEIGKIAPVVVDRMIAFANENLVYQENDYTHPTRSSSTKSKPRKTRESFVKRYAMPEEQGGDAEFVVSGKITNIGSKETQMISIRKSSDPAFSLTVTREVQKSGKDGEEDKVVIQKLQKVDGTGAWDLETHGKDKPWHVQGRGYQQKDVCPSDPLVTFNWFLDTPKQEVIG